MTKEFLYRMAFEYRQIILYVFLGILGLVLMAVVQNMYNRPATPQPTEQPVVPRR